jgi:PEP-CTERM motif
MKTIVTLAIQAVLIAFPHFFCAHALQAASEVGQDYGVLKGVKRNQTGVGTFSPATNPWRIDAFVQAASNGSLTGGTLTLPPGSSATSPQTLVPQDGGAYGFQQKFADQATLNSNFADGTYGLQITGASSTTYNASLSLTGGVFPSLSPTVTNTNWSGGGLIVDPSAAFTLTWGAFTGSTASDQILISFGKSGQQTLSVQVLPSAATSEIFAANFFQPNQNYNTTISFLDVATIDTREISGSTGFAGYSTETSFTINAVPEPTTWAMLSLGFMLLLALMRWQRRLT